MNYANAFAGLLMSLTMMGCAAPSTASLASYDASKAMSGHREIARFEGDVDGDGVVDRLSVLDRSAESEAQMPRTLLITSGRDGVRTVAPSAVLCKDCGGMFGDPLDSIDPRGDGFVLRFEGGSRELWSQEFEFAHDPKQRIWRLIRRTDQAADRLTNEAVSSQKNFSAGEAIDLREFDPLKIPAE